MATLDLATVKLYCRIDHSDEDALVEKMIAAATEHVADIGVDVSGDTLPNVVELAILMLVAYFYDHREAFATGSTRAVDTALDRLLAPLREVAL